MFHFSTMVSFYSLCYIYFGILCRELDVVSVIPSALISPIYCYICYLIKNIDILTLLCKFHVYDRA